MKGFIFSDKIIVTSEEEVPCFGKKIGKYRIISPYCAMYLVENNKLEVYLNGKRLHISDLKSYFKSKIKEFDERYSVFKMLIAKGYKIGSGFKFGAEFRVYEKNVDPDSPFVHSKWICYPVNPENEFEFHELSAKNRVAHSTKKSLLIGIVGKTIEFIEIKWMRM